MVRVTRVVVPGLMFLGAVLIVIGAARGDGGLRDLSGDIDGTMVLTGYALFGAALLLAFGSKLVRDLRGERTPSYRELAATQWAGSLKPRVVAILVTCLVMFIGLILYGSLTY